MGKIIHNRIITKRYEANTKTNYQSNIIIIFTINLYTRCNIIDNHRYCYK